MDRDLLKKYVNDSGFPLQIRVRHLIQENSRQYGWQVRYEEHQWKLREESGFIDLVAQSRDGSMSLVIECKRPRNADWIFLVDKEAELEHGHSGWLADKVETDTREFAWTAVNVQPSSYQSSFCVVRGQNDNSPMLERLCAPLLFSTQSLALQELEVAADTGSHFRWYFPVIVTTAQLRVCRIDPEKISLEDGTLESADFEDVGYVRFKKQLSEYTTIKLRNEMRRRRPNYDARIDVEALEDSVFVVNTTHLLDFLADMSANLF